MGVSSRAHFSCLVLVVLLLFTFSSEAREFMVNGKENSWKIPSSPDDFDKWAEKNRFQIGDSLVIQYDNKTDSVLQVAEEDFKSCNKANPIKTYDSGTTKIELDRSGPFFFISGAEGHCEKGQKLEVKVLSIKHGGSKGGSPAPAPAPAAENAQAEIQSPAPAPAPTGGARGLSCGAIMGVFMLVGLALV